MKPFTSGHRGHFIIPYDRLLGTTYRNLVRGRAIGTEVIGYTTFLRGLVALVVWFLTFPWASVLSQEMSGEVAPGSTSSSIDCSEISIDYVEDPSLTREEKIAVMDEALFRSLSKFESCETSRQSSELGTVGDGSSSDGNTGGSEGDVNSQPSPDIAGTESPTAADEASTASDPTADSILAGNGKVPDDIPSMDNDSILEAQIRKAAMNEPDPVVREKLWNEYRRYKGLEELDEERAGQEENKEIQEAVPSGNQGEGDNAVLKPELEGEQFDTSRLATKATGDIALSPAKNGEPKIGSETLDNGKVPDDIPPADNDSFLESQIREAAMKENDPEAREKLWEEYRRYKSRDELFVE